MRTVVTAPKRSLPVAHAALALPSGSCPPAGRPETLSPPQRQFPPERPFCDYDRRYLFSSSKLRLVTFLIPDPRPSPIRPFLADPYQLLDQQPQPASPDRALPPVFSSSRTEHCGFRRLGARVHRFRFRRELSFTRNRSKNRVVAGPGHQAGFALLVPSQVGAQQMCKIVLP